jgi:hypothetical protein
LLPWWDFALRPATTYYLLLVQRAFYRGYTGHREGDAMAGAADARARIEFVTAGPQQLAGLGRIEGERRLYLVASFAMLVITVIGFRQFLLHARSVGGVPMTPEIVGLIVMHGIAMLGWIVLLCVQSTLIVASRRRLHITLGRIGPWLAGAIVVFGVVVAPLSAHYNPPAYTDFGGARYFLALMWPEPVTFGVFAAVAFRYRHRPEVHRPMMLLATVGMMTGSLARLPYWDALLGLVHGSVAVAMFGQMLVLGAIVFVADTAIARRFDRYFLAGLGGQVIATVLSAIVARSAAWNHFAGLITQ